MVSFVGATRLGCVFRLVLALAVVAALFGCAEQRIHDQSRRALGAGDYESALLALEEGTKQNPDSMVLRSALIQTRADIVSRMSAEAAGQRVNGRLDEAQQTLQRAWLLDPPNPRLPALIAEIDVDRRQQAALVDAQDQARQQHPDAALRTIAQALKDNPRQADLLALQRKLEAGQRQQQVRAAQAVLAETRPISLDFRDANLRTVLDVVSRNSGINFVLDRDIKPDTRVTVFLRQAKVEDALDLIVGTNQLAKKVIDPQTIVIYPNTPDKQHEYQEQIVRVFYLASVDAKGAAAFLKAMLKIREPFVDERSNMLALRESQDNIELAERLIALYDAGDPEVLLDVEVLEVSATRLTDLGVQFPDSLSLTLLPSGTATSLTLSDLKGITRNRVGLGVAGATVNFKREVDDATTLANPKIRVRNKEKAKIMVGDKIPVVTSTTGQTGFVADSVTYLDVGLKLDVEPTVYADDDVGIKVGLEVSSLGTATTTASGTVAYQIGTRNATTVLRLHDGETQLLAGLISKDDRTSASRLPGLGDLPVLGRLFSDQTDNATRTELVLAITPRVLRNIRRPDANESEMWVGTEAQPKLRPVGGLRSNPLPPMPAASSPLAAPSVTIGPAVAAASAPDREATVAATQLQWLGPATAKPGDVVEIALDISTSASIRGMPAEMTFSNDKLALVDVSEGDFFKQGGVVTSFSTSDGAGGYIHLGILRNQATGASGQGKLVTLRFKTLSAGAAEVRLSAAHPLAVGTTAPDIRLPAPFVLQVQ